MSYIWEDKNRGKSLYEMAIIKHKALMEAGEDNNRTYYKLDTADNEALHKLKEAGGRRQGNYIYFDNDKADNNLIQQFQKDDWISGPVKPNWQQDAYTTFNVDANARDQVKGVLDDNKIQYEFNGDGTQLKLNTSDINKDCIKKMVGKGKWLTPSNAQSQEEQIDTNRQQVIKALIEKMPDSVHDTVEFAVREMLAGKWFNGSEPANDAQEQAIQNCKDAVANGKKEDLEKIVHQIGFLAKSGKIKVDENNKQLYKETKENTQITGNVQMPSMFDSEPDDTMWQDIVVTAFGIPMINMGHPVSKKVLASENPEDECPGDLKQFKKAVYEDPRLQHVFGKGGIERIIAGKLTNLLTLGIAAATVDAGKRADRIIKELKDKGGMTTHRNLLLAKYDDIVDVDPDNEGATVKVRPYNRSKGKLMDEIEVPASLLKQFYAAVDPVQSSKIYLEIYGKDDDMIKALQESGMSIDGNAITEGLVSGIVSGTKAAANGAKNLGHALNTKGNLKTMFAGNDSKNEVNKQQEVDDDTKKKLANLKQQFIKKISVTGHPDAYVLKPKSANKEVDVISRSSTGQFHGGKVLMVTLKISDQNGEHTAAAFMTPNECKEYFAV